MTFNEAYFSFYGAMNFIRYKSHAGINDKDGALSDLFPQQYHFVNHSLAISGEICHCEKINQMSCMFKEYH